MICPERFIGLDKYLILSRRLNDVDLTLFFVFLESLLIFSYLIFDIFVCIQISLKNAEFIFIFSLSCFFI